MSQLPLRVLCCYVEPEVVRDISLSWTKPTLVKYETLTFCCVVFTHPRFSGMGIAIARILTISFANIGEVTDWIEVNFGVCIVYRHTIISTTGFVKLLYCVVFGMFRKLKNNQTKEQIVKK